MGCDDPLAERDADGVAAGLAGLDDDPRHLASPYGIRQRTYENPDPHRQLRTAASPPDRPRRDGPPGERRETNPGDPTAPTTARSQANFATAPRLPGGRGMREASRALGPMSAGVLIKLPRHPAPPPSTFGGACAYLLMQRAKRQNHPGARRFPSFPYRAVPINNQHQPAAWRQPDVRARRDLPWIGLVKRRAGGGLSARTAARSSPAPAGGRARRRWRVWPR